MELPRPQALYDARIANLVTRVRSETGSREPLLALAMAFNARSMPEEARAACTALLALDDADPDAWYERIIAGNEQDHAASGHWGVPTFAFENEPFFGQDRIDLLVWRMESKGLSRREK